MALFRKRGSSSASDVTSIAGELGLTITSTVDDGYRATMGPMPDVPLLHENDAATMSRIMYGTVDDRATALFLFVIEGHRSNLTTPRRSCVLFTFADVNLPEVFLWPRGQLHKLGEQLREGGIALGASSPLGHYTVQAHNRAQALQLLGPELQAWLAEAHADDLHLEINGTAVLVHVAEVQGADGQRALLSFAQGIIERIPTDAWNRFGSHR